MVFCYQNCSDQLWEKIVLVIEKNFLNLRLKAENVYILEVTRTEQEYRLWKKCESTWFGIWLLGVDEMIQNKLFD